MKIKTKQTSKSMESTLKKQSQLEKSPSLKKKVWKNYDFENLPELNQSQLKSFKKVSNSQHTKFKNAVTKHFGRPKKDPSLKENIISIRFSNILLEKIKKRAHTEGYTAWQSFAKKVLIDYLESKK